jgi:putative peptide zinc metalloprotease protein
MVAALVYLKVAAFCFQLLVFLRTDLYAVLVTAAGCRNLWQVKSLLLRGAFGRLTPDQRRILAAADPRDLRTGRWFRWLYLAGLLALAGYFSAFVLPVLWGVARWTAAGLTAGPGQATFWWTTTVTVIIWYPVAAAAAIAARTRHHRHGADPAVLPGSPASESQS